MAAAAMCRRSPAHTRLCSPPGHGRGREPPPRTPPGPPWSPRGRAQSGQGAPPPLTLQPRFPAGPSPHPPKKMGFGASSPKGTHTGRLCGVWCCPSGGAGCAPPVLGAQQSPASSGLTPVWGLRGSPGVHRYRGSRNVPSLKG